MRKAVTVCLVCLSAALACSSEILHDDILPPLYPGGSLELPEPPGVSIPASFSFERSASDDAATLSVSVQELNQTTGEVLVNGVDTRPVTVPFTFSWGDGAEDDGWFPMGHTYRDTSRDYVVTVLARYESGESATDQVGVRFAGADLRPISFPDAVRVEIPTLPVSLGSRLDSVPTGLDAFDDSSFMTASRSAVEYVLSIAAWIQCEFANGDVYAPDGTFRQLVLRDQAFSGMYSLWYTTPVSFAAGGYAFEGSPHYSSFFHEMGHNVTLNSPAEFYFGGKVDGCANAIYSETMAQIFQHATAYEIINNADTYGLGDGLSSAIRESAVATYEDLARTFRSYVARGCPFDSWNDPAPGDDEDVFETFITIAYVFCRHAEQAGEGFREPVKRMMELLQTFDAEMQAEFSQGADSPEAVMFRATLMVAAVSYAFDTDLRGEFRGLGFPISDAQYEILTARVSAAANMLFEDFDESGDWQVAGGMWHTTAVDQCTDCDLLTGKRAHFGRDSSSTPACNYLTPGHPSQGSLYSPEVPLPPGVKRLGVDFDSFRHVESYEGAYDQAWVEVRFDFDGPWLWVPIWYRDSRDASPVCEHVRVCVDVPDGASQVLVRFRFDSVDNLSNSLPGWAVDNVAIVNADLVPRFDGCEHQSLRLADAARTRGEEISVMNVPNPIRGINTTTFVVRALDVKAVRVQVYDLSGALVYEEETEGNQLVWHTQGFVGTYLANGVYIYRAWAWIGDTWFPTQFKKLVILR